MDMKRRILSCFLAFCMIFALLPAPAQAAGNAENATPTVTATVQHAATGQITAQIEAYMTDSANKTRTVKPCDIIFLIEQSQFMNTQNGSASSGDERAEILSAIDRLLDGMPQPTTGGEHRIAIAGYGRINNPGRSDGYNAALYPGTPSDNNDSLNTGYYTTSGFHSQSGWTEYSKDDPKALPQLPSGYLPDDYNYDDVFLSVDNAKQVIDADKMVPWYAGAARMDAGLTITEQLAKIAKAEADSKDRNLIVCIAASSLPYQNSGTYQKLRPDAAIEAANTLKKTYGATIFGLGDFNQLKLESGNPLNDPDEQRKNFNDTMASICGNTSAHGADYFKGLSQVHDIDTALNELMTKIDANVGEGAAEELSIDVDHFTEGKDRSYSWSQLKDGHHILSAGSIREVASVDYYRFTGYDSSGTPLFEPTPSRHTEQSLADIGRGNAIKTSLNILPIPPQAKAGETIRGANYGEKVVITITDPVCIDYDWIGRWKPANLAPPKHEHAARGTTHKPAAPTQNAVAGKDLNLKFDGWYRLWDETIDQGKPTWTYNGNTYVKYTGTVFPAFGSDLKLYGRWLPEIQVSFHWAGSVIPVDGDGNKIAAPSALSLSLDGNGKRYYQATALTADGFEFDGWYKDSDCTQKFQEGGEDLTANTNLYGRWTRLGTKTVTFKVKNGKWSNGTAEDNTVTVELRNGLGTLSPKDVPTGMTPDTDHKAPGAWDSHPNTNTDGISETGNYVYTYTFPQKDKCTVTYHWLSTENPDSAALPPQATVTENTSYPVETVPDIKGWTFSGWYDNEACEGKRVDKEINIKDQNIDLYGKWTHNPCTVTFRADYEGAERGYLDANKQTVVLTYTVPYGSTLRKERISLPTPVPGEATYYFFKDWDLDNLFYTDPDVLDMPVRSNLTFVAQWWPIVTFDANGGAWSSGETIETMHYVKIQTDTEKVAAESTPVRNGYTFLGWYTAADGGVRANFEDTVNGPTTLYAHWAKNAAVTFRIVNGTWSGGAAEDKTVTVVLYPQADGTASGTLDASYVPQIMLPAPGYENIAGGWEQTPNTDPNGITGDVTYVYRFGSTGGGSSSGHSTRYTLHYESNGGTAYKDERCSSGTKVTLDKTPTRESYTFTGWYADKALTQKITSVTMNGDKTVYAGWEATGVPDKLNGDDHFAYVVGYSDSTVRPSANISRAETATIFFRLLKSDIRDGNLTADNDFSDVSDGQWHNKAISTMAKLGIVKGRRADRFDPDASITRAEFAAICARFNTKPVENSSSFSDISGHWAENEIERAAAFGWISGYPDGTFRPDARITRAEAMTMINRVLCRMPQSESDLLDSMVTWPDNKPSDWHYLAVQEATNSHDFDRQGEVGESWTKLTSVPDWTRYQ